MFKKLILLIPILFIILFALARNAQAANPSPFPTGVLIKAQNDSKVYLIENGYKRHIPSPLIFESQFSWDNVITITSEEVASYPNGDAMKFKDGTLVKDKNSAYVIESGLARPIVSAAVFDLLGYKWPNVIAVSDSEFNLHPRGEMVTRADVHTNGILVTAGGPVYVLDNGKKRYIPSPGIFNARFRVNNTVTISPQELDSYPLGDHIVFPEGYLLSDDNSVYLIQDGQRRPIGHATIFESYGFKWNMVKKVTPFELGFHSVGSIIGSPKIFYSGSLIRSFSSPEVYFIDSGTARHITSPNVFRSYGFKWEDILIVSQGAADSYSKGEKMGFKDGTLIAGNWANGAVYIIENGKKRPFPDPKTFEGLGYKWGNIITVSSEELSIALDGPIKTPEAVDVRVGIYADVGTVQVTADGNYQILLSNSELLTTLSAGTIVSVAYENGNYHITASGVDRISSGYPTMMPVNGSVMQVVSYNDCGYEWTCQNIIPNLNYNKFRGSIEVKYIAVKDPYSDYAANVLWAINVIPLEYYLRGLAEANNSVDVPEYLKALGVSARTYAMRLKLDGTKHDEIGVDLLNSRKGNGNDQQYFGYLFEERNKSLVDLYTATSGEIITYNNYPIVAAYSSGTCGRTKSAKEAGWADTAYLQSVDDPHGIIGNCTTLEGNHMVGLSAQGARGYAKNEGKDYQWILKHYYTGVTIEKRY